MEHLKTVSGSLTRTDLLTALARLHQQGQISSKTFLEQLQVDPLPPTMMERIREALLREDYRNGLRPKPGPVSRPSGLLPSSEPQLFR